VVPLPGEEEEESPGGSTEELNLFNKIP